MRNPPVGKQHIKFNAPHGGQAKVCTAMNTSLKPRGAREILRAGRRFGKTTLFEDGSGNWAANKLSVGWFSPNYKLLRPSYMRILKAVRPIVANANRMDGIIELHGGGSIEFWTLNDPDAGRSRKYHKVVVDEAGLVATGLRDIWEQAIAPTLLDYNGDAYMTGTPKGEDPEAYFYEACTDKALGWNEHHASTYDNPTLSAEAVAKIKDTTPPLVFRQEYLAEFVNWNGVQFFELAKLLGDDGHPVDMPLHVEKVFAVVDTALKTGTDNDGTAVTYYALNRMNVASPLTVLDWDIVQLEGAALETWLPSVYTRLEELAQLTKAMHGSVGAFIEDKGSGTVLLQQAARRGWDAYPIDSKLTSVGKDERALSVSGYVYRGLVKVCGYAYHKVKEYKQRSANHFLKQVLGFVLADKDAAKRADDLLDTFTYGIAIALGNGEGY